jgi:hypothetical protein
MKTRRHLRILLTIAVLFPAHGLFAQTDMTNLITNPSFETGDYTGWTWTGWTGGWQNVNNDGGTTKDGNFIAGHWNNNIAEVECAQTITGLANGYYMVTALATVSNERLTNQRLFANNKSTLYGEKTAAPYTEANLAILGGLETFSFGGYPTVSTENGPFKKLSVTKQVTDGSLTFGFRFSGKGTALGYDFSYSTKNDAGFFKFDNFKLTEVSNLATLKSLTLSVGALSSNFVADTFSYSSILPVGTTTVTPIAVPAVEGVSVVGTGAVDVSSGKGISTITVTAMDGKTKKTYIINYTVLEQSDDALLSSLVISEGTLSPAFSPMDTVYTVYLPIGTKSVTSTASTNDVLATATGDGVVALINGTAKSVIKVTAENGTVKNYTIQYDWAYITNPSFETGDFTGWAWIGAEGYVWEGVNNDGDETKSGTNIAGVWNPGFKDVELSQTITGLANGNYKVTADLMGSSNGASSRLTTQRLFANGRSMLFGASTDSSYTAENLAILGATEVYSFGGYSVTQRDNGPFQKLTVVAPVTDGTLTLGIRTNGDSSALGYKFPKLIAGDGHGWFKVDNFTLRYDGPLTALAQVKEQNATFMVSNGSLFVKNAACFIVYNLQGVKVVDVKSNESNEGVALKPGLYIVKADGKSFKVSVK